MPKISALPPGSTLTGTEALVAVQGNGTVQIPVTQIRHNEYSFAATAADIGAALNAFMVTIHDLGGGTVLLPPGSFLTSVQIVVPNLVTLSGAGKRTTTITASGLAINTYLVRLGRVADAPAIFDCAITDMQLSCAQIAGSGGVYIVNANEGCGCFRIIVKNFKDTGVFYDTYCENFRNEEMEVLALSACNYCVKIIGTGFPADGQLLLTFDRVTLIGTGIANCLAGMYVRNAQIVVMNMHLEGAADGVTINGDNVAGAIIGVNSTGGVTNLIHFDSAAELAVFGAAIGFATKILRDDVSGTVLNDSFLPMWSRKPAYSTSVPTTVTAASYVVLDTDTAIIANRAGAVTLTLPPTSAGRVLRVKNIQSFVVLSIASDVVPLAGGAAGTAILPAVAGSWAELQSNGTNWIITAQSKLEAGAITIQSGATYTVLATDSTIINNNAAGTLTLTFPAPLNGAGKIIHLVNYQAQTVVSAAADVVSLTGVTGTAILAATAGKWATLQWRGDLWFIIAGN